MTIAYRYVGDNEAKKRLIPLILFVIAVIGVASAEGSFDLQWSGDLGTRAWGIAIGDADNDALNEIVVVTTENVSILEWDPVSDRYVIAWQKDYPGTHNLKSVVIEDADNDGLNEVAMAGATVYEKRGLIYEWDGSTYVLQGTTPHGGRDTYSIAIGNIDNVVGNEVVVGTTDMDYSGFVRVYKWNNMTGIYEEQWSYGDPFHGKYGNFLYGNRNIIGDMDSDGVYEILTGDYLGSKILIKWNGTTYHPQCFDRVAVYGWYAYGLGIGDLDNNSFNELVIGADFGIGTFEWDNNSETYIEYIRIRPDNGTYWFGIAIDDIDHDNVSELVAGNNRGIYVLEWNGSGYVQLWSQDIGENVFGVAIGDADNDGFNEFVAGNQAGEVWVFQYFAIQ